MQWLNNLKIAIVEENITQIKSLTKELPSFDSKIEAQEALALIGEAIKILDNKKEQTLEAMNKIKKTKKYFEQKRSLFKMSV
ncbi:MAG: hypothetical protein JJV95_05480 [Sulfurospirillum sp.]|nr:hypothetical protein [Sulfurospirillum sp.]MBL0703417.1 hypothetical protein [Sulfurospirillum sp.]